MKDSKFELLHCSFVYEPLNIELKNYLFLNLKEKKKLLEYRNHSSVRSKMINDKPITMESHLDFMESLATKNEGYWTLNNEKGTILGTLNLTKYDDETDSFMGGNFSDPSLIGSGIGLALNYFLHYVAFEKINSSRMRAIIKKDHKSAIRLNQIFGGKKVSSPTIEGEPYIEMVFNREAWYGKVERDVSKYLKYVF